ncbi:hypothetical protein K458DRAFT_293005 [Lentithecium fluviatile CBS 122367]|uniref:Uncharacterized protein n=1 Tax=Lentithecium fluviatile CBS 122367 TaxID=1168545 RepID=A0A6G1JEI6_9PLEO|nr:hypothetical protein K458DRAFT_293005 [Lentithecium fluviatile CBS 122367]
MFGSRRYYLSLLGVVAWFTTAANTTLDIIDATSLSGTHVSFTGLVIAASVLDFVALGSLTVFTIQHAWTRDGIVKDSRGRRMLATSCIALSAGAMIVSLVSVVTIKTRREDISPSRSSGPVTNWNSHLAGQIVVWVLAFLGQIALFSSPLWSKPTQEGQIVTVSGPRDSVMSEVRHSNTTTNLYVLQPTQPSSPLAGLPSPTFSARSSNSLKSWRDSLQHVVRPVTSRTKLIKQPSFTRDAPSLYSIDNRSIKSASHPDGFDSWEVDPSTRDAVVQIASTVTSPSATAPVSAPSRGTALEPIPGSRPASPARALDGPFPSSDDSDSELVPPPKMMPDISRPPSPAVSEAHIHPLFRTESPTPPPAATPGTNILASPLATQMITCPPRPYSRMRSNSSRAASPSPLHRAISPQGNSSRSPSPPTREMTPPIPDFVLNSSPRSSTSQSRRKVSLQVETSR